MVTRNRDRREARPEVQIDFGPTGGRIMERAGSQSSYTARLAESRAEIQAAQRLRFEVFNLELREGLPEAHLSGLDADVFDGVCDHLLVEENSSGKIVGTYRMQTGLHAALNHGYYSAQEFELAPFEPQRARIIELGRACVASDHRNLSVLGLLWRGISDYAKKHGCSYLIGCSSLTSQDPQAGAAVYADLCHHYLADPEFQTVPKPDWTCPVDRKAASAPKIPKLLRAYLAVGAKICGPPAIDRQFKTIDFLTLFDFETLPPEVIRRYFS